MYFSLRRNHIIIIGLSSILLALGFGLIALQTHISYQASAAQRGIQTIDDVMTSGPKKAFTRKLTGQALPTNFVKVLNVPYFNQWVDPVGSSPEEYYARRMCGAASSTMVAGYFNKISYDKNNEQDVKRYMYSDQGKNLPTKCGQFGIGGTFGMTAVDGNCNASTIWNVEAYYNRIGLAVERKGGWVYGMGNINFNTVVESINRGRPVVLSSSSHYVVIKGYTNDGRVIVNDSFKDASKGSDRTYIYGNGKDAVYDVNNMYPFDPARYQDHYAAFSVYDPSNPGFDDSNAPAAKVWNNATGKVWSALDNAVFEVRDVSPNLGAQVWIAGDRGGVNQRFDFDPRTLTIKGMNDMCIGFSGQNSFTERLIRTMDCNLNDARIKWFYNDVGSLVSLVDNNQCIDRYSAAGGYQNSLYLGNCHFKTSSAPRNITNQTFILPLYEVSKLNTASQTISLVGRDDLVINTVNAVVGNQIELNMRRLNDDQFNYDKTNSARWLYNSGTGEIKGANNKCLDGGNGGNWNLGSEQVRIHTCHGGGNQKWDMLSNGLIQSRNSNYCMSLNSADYGTSIYLRFCNSQSNLQRFVMGGSSTIPTNTTKSGNQSRRVLNL
jgi:hypothetical protein